MVKTKKRMTKQRISVTPGSGNVFADLGLENAEELLIKADLSLEIYKRVKTLGLSQAQAGKRLSISQPDVSRLMNGRHTRFSCDRLFVLLNRLGVDVEICLRPHTNPKQAGTIRFLGSYKKNAR